MEDFPPTSDSQSQMAPRLWTKTSLRARAAQEVTKKVPGGWGGGSQKSQGLASKGAAQTDSREKKKREAWQQRKGVLFQPETLGSI